jgi:hypothetical protein
MIEIFAGIAFMLALLNGALFILIAPELARMAESLERLASTVEDGK